MSHLTIENEYTFDLIRESDVSVLSSSKLALRDRFGGFLHVEATQSSQVMEVYVANKESPSPLYYFLHYGLIIANTFAIGSMDPPRTYNYLLVHALRYEDKLKYQLFFTNSLESAQRRVCIMEGYLHVTNFASISTNTSAFKWLEVLKKNIGRKISNKPADSALSCITAVKELYGVMIDKNAEQMATNTLKALQAAFTEFSVSTHASLAPLTDRSFNKILEQFFENMAKFLDSM